MDEHPRDRHRHDPGEHAVRKHGDVRPASGADGPVRSVYHGVDRQHKSADAHERRGERHDLVGGVVKPRGIRCDEEHHNADRRAGRAAERGELRAVIPRAVILLRAEQVARVGPVVLHFLAVAAVLYLLAVQLLNAWRFFEP